MDGTLRGLSEYLSKNSGTNMVIFAGKGGLGKTTCSAALAYHTAAKEGRNCLCFSTDPQASLSDIFEMDLFGKGEVEVSPNLHVVEIDADRRVKEYTDGIKRKIRDMYKVDEIPPEIESYIDTSSAEPAMYESATYDAMAEYLAARKYGLYIFDMPPFGHGVRMIAMAEVLSMWVDKIADARQKAKEYDEVAATLRGSRVVTEDKILSELLDIKGKLTFFTDTMLDRNKTAFFMVLTPEKMSIIDTEKALEMFKKLGLGLSGIVVNQVLPKHLADTPSPFLSQRVRMQKKYLKEITDKFGEQVVTIIPMFPHEPKGLPMLAEVAEHLLYSPITL